MWPNCRDCADLQQEVPAVAMIGKTAVCLVHQRSRLGIPKTAVSQATGGQLATRRSEDATMSRGPSITQDTINAIRQDAAAGLSFSKIAEKNGVSWPTAKHYVKNGHAPAGGGGKCAGKAKQHAATNGHFAVQLSAEGLDAVWNALPAEKKAELLGHL